MGCDSKRLYHFCRRRLFQSTQPEWAATYNADTVKQAILFQSTQPEWAATVIALANSSVRAISIHAARMGCDGVLQCDTIFHKDFNPRSPNGLRRAGKMSENLPAIYFNPRSPNGLRHIFPCNRYAQTVISIHAARMGCDHSRLLPFFLISSISIHAARMGCDLQTGCSIQHVADFNPRSPNGLRPCCKIPCHSSAYDFNPRSPNGLRPSI